MTIPVRDSHGVDSEQLIDPFHHARGDRVLGVELERVEELPPRMRRPASGVHQLRGRPGTRLYVLKRSSISTW
jgi:hypothetical protein